MQLEAARLAALAADRRLAESFHESERQRQQELELSRQAAELLYEQDRRAAAADCARRRGGQDRVAAAAGVAPAARVWVGE